MLHVGLTTSVASQSRGGCTPRVLPATKTMPRGRQGRALPPSVVIDARTQGSLDASLKDLELSFQDLRDRADATLTCRIRTPPARPFPTLHDVDILQCIMSVVGTHAPEMHVIPVFDRVDRAGDAASCDSERASEGDQSTPAWEARLASSRLILPSDAGSSPHIASPEERGEKNPDAHDHATPKAADETLSTQPVAFNTVAVGGTFDRLHAGHRLLLGATALVSTQRVFIGVTSDKLLQNKVCKEKLQAYHTRVAAAVAFTKSVRGSLDVSAGPLTDPALPPLCATEEAFTSWPSSWSDCSRRDLEDMERSAAALYASRAPNDTE
jgi:hypothetical protein